MKRLFIEEINPVTRIPVRFTIAHEGGFCETSLEIEGRINQGEDEYLLDYLRMWNLGDFFEGMRAEIKEDLDRMGYDTDYNNYCELFSVIVPMFPHYYHLPTKKMI